MGGVYLGNYNLLIDVEYDSAWHSLDDGTAPKKSGRYIEYYLDGIHTVERVRISKVSSWFGYLALYECGFGIPSLSRICRIAFDSNPFDDTPVWTDVSDDLVEFHINRGRQHELNRIQVGELTVVLRNAHGNYWPKNTGGTYYGKLLPLKRINIQVVYNGVTYDRYTGYIDDYDPGYVSSPLLGPIVTLTCVDGMESLTRLLVSDYDAELSGTRWANILDDRGWPADERDLADGQSTIQAGPATPVIALEHGYNVNDTEFGLFFISRDGKATFHDRMTRSQSPFDTAVATFGDGVGELRYRGIRFSSGRQYIYNDIRMTREGGTEQTAEDATSQTTYAERTLSKTGLLHNSDDDTQDEAYFVLRRQKDAVFRVTSMSLLPAGDPDNMFPVLLASDISTRITLKVTDASVDEDYHIEGFREDWSIWEPDNYIMELQLSNASDLAYPERETLTLRPNAAGDSTENYVYGAATNWEAVLTDADGSHVAAGGNIGRPLLDLYNLDDIVSVDGPVVGVKVHARVKVEWSVGVNSARLAIKTGGTTYYGEYIYNPGDSEYHDYTFSRSIILSVEDINSLQAGVELSSNYEYYGVYCDYLYVEINYYSGW